MNAQCDSYTAPSRIHCFSDIDLLCGQRFVMLRRRHPLGGIVRSDATDDFALVRLAGHDRRDTRIAAFQGTFSQVEPQAPLALGLIHTVTLRAMLRQDRLDITLITDGRSSPRALTTTRMSNNAEEKRVGMRQSRGDDIARGGACSVETAVWAQKSSAIGRPPAATMGVGRPSVPIH